MVCEYIKIIEAIIFVRGIPFLKVSQYIERYIENQSSCYKEKCHIKIPKCNFSLLSFDNFGQDIWSIKYFINFYLDIITNFCVFR